MWADCQVLFFIEYDGRENEMSILVKNLHNTSDRRPDGYRNWKEFWEAKAGRRFGKCACVSCGNRAEAGGHVKAVYGGNEWYITPLCEAHNNYNFNYNFYVPADSLVRVR